VTPPPLSWTWIVPLLVTLGVFSGVLLTTPPGFGAISDVLFGLPRGPNAEGAAYALGAAGSLACVSLVVSAAVCASIDTALQRSGRR
jgi:hypothetical protein